MRRSWMILAAALGLLIGMTWPTWTGSIEPQSGKGVLAGLKVGQPVTLTNEGAAYEVRVTDEPLPTVEEVAEIGVDYLVIKSEAGIETRIPVTSIKAVVRTSTR